MIRPSSNVIVGRSTRQLIRYGLVGVASNLTMYFCYLLITNLGVEPKRTMTLVYVFGVFIGFVGNRKWTFAHSGNSIRVALQYIMAHLVGYLINFLILFCFVDRLGYPHQWVQAVAIIVIAGLLFAVLKYFVFGGERI